MRVRSVWSGMLRDVLLACILDTMYLALYGNIKQGNYCAQAVVRPQCALDEPLDMSGLHAAVLPLSTRGAVVASLKGETIDYSRP